MSLALIRAENKTILEGIAGIGKVHDYERWSVEWKKFLDQFKSADGKIKGWTVTREKSSERFTGGSTSERLHSMTLRGYHGLDDASASEKVFQDLVEEVCNTFRPKTTLNGRVDRAEAPLQVDIIEHRLFGGVLCHYCELRQAAQETIGFTQNLPANVGGGLSAIRSEYKNILLSMAPIKIGPGYFKFGDAARFRDGVFVGGVYDYERWAAEWKKMLDIYKDPDSGKINGWTISRESSPEIFIPGCGSERRHAIVVRGYFGLEDDEASEKIFQDLIEVICSPLPTETNLPGRAHQVEVPVQVDSVETPL